MSAKDHLSYVRLRSPAENKTELNVPQADQVDGLFAANLDLRSSYPADLRVFADVARRNLFDAAIAYSRRYLPEVDQWRDGVSADRILMAGHQPALFHPGVWYKNFRLDALAKHYDAVGINLVVDNDLLMTPAIGCPQITGSDVKLALLRYDKHGAAMPHEGRPILDEARFEAFAKTASASIGPVVGSPVIERLWPEVLRAKEILGGGSLGRVLAAGRHRLEWQAGLRTLEVPISVVAGTVAFGAFAGRVLFEIEKFHAIYNRVLLSYRDRHGIRSTSHPVPELARSGDWREAPFWIWTEADPQRRPLFVKIESSGSGGGGSVQAENFCLSDLDQFEATVGIGEFAGWWSEQAKSNGVCIRPRALTTTMFHRLLASDLFIHGIGGAKYDQLTDQIIEDFFGVQPPGYLTSTATFTLPFDTEKVTPADIVNQKRLLRSLRFHPEKHVPATGDNEALILEKRQAIEALRRSRENTQQSGRVGQGTVAKEANDRIEAANAALFQQLASQADSVRETIEQLRSRLGDSQLLYSREYSFALHRVSIIEELLDLSRV